MAPNRPAGTVTFLFSDIEGSTKRWERNREVMDAALKRHDALMRAALTARGAYVFKTIGDAFCAAFACASDAIAAALDAQRSLAREDFSAVEGIRVRMALHAGTTTERDGDYFGPTVNRVARLLAIGYGGQVLISAACAELGRDAIVPPLELLDLGKHRLKDLTQPEHVYQLLAPDLATTFPQLRSFDNLSNNLPAQITSFVGREDAIAEITSLLERHRLVTLVGTGGAGKTRSAIQAGAEILDRFRDGVWLIELAPLGDSSLVATTIAQTLGLREQPNTPAIESLLAYLKRRQLLLILDNCEHVIGDARTIAATVLRDCSEVSILATSRESLNLTGEEIYRMPSLSVPPQGRDPTAAAVLAFGAPQLFADRARAIDRRFSVTDENAGAVAEICRRLDGIPLAIELAAARSNVIAPKKLANMLDDRFRLLTGGDRSALPRHQTMRALIDWSYDLLSVEERSLFRKLSIFAGGFTLELAVELASDESDEWTLLERLSSLVDKSLLQGELTDGDTRYRYLESTRQYARERLEESGEHDGTATSHAATCLKLARDIGRARWTAADRDWVPKANRELENFRAALGWTLKNRGNILLGQQLVGALSWLWANRGAAEGSWIRLAKQLVDATTPEAVVAELDLAETVMTARNLQGEACIAAAERAIARYRALGDRLGAAVAEQNLGHEFIKQGRLTEGETVIRRALETSRAEGTDRLTSSLLIVLAFARAAAGDADAARRFSNEALAIGRARGFSQLTGSVSIFLAEAEFRAGNASAALEAIAEARSNQAYTDTAVVLANAPAYLVALGRYDEAVGAAREALAAIRKVAENGADEAPAAWVLQHLAAVGALRPCSELPCEERRRAARLLGYVNTRLAALESPREYTEQHEYDVALAALRKDLDAEELAKLLNEGGSWDEDRAVAEALLV